MGTRILFCWSWIVLAALFALGMPGGCQKERPTQSNAAQEPRLVEFRANRTVLAPGDTTLMKATVVRGPEPGDPASGVEVVFGEMLDAQNGAFSKVQGTTAADGVATTVFRAAAGDSGVVTLKAGLVNSADYKYEMLLVTRAPSSVLALAAQTAGDATGLPADGHSQLEITVTAIQGAAHSPVPSLPLVLTAGDQFVDENHNGIHDTGEPLVAAGDRNGNGTWDPQGVLPERVTTDAQGTAKFVYQAGTDVGPVFVRVTSAPGASPLGASIEIQLLQHSLAHTVEVTPGVRQLLADGVSETPVTVLVTNWERKPEVGVVVKLVAGEAFTDVDGDGYYTPSVDQYVDANQNGIWDAIGSVSPSVATTGEGGLATVTYRAGLRAGDVALRASTTSGFSERVLNLVSGPPANAVTIRLAVDFLVADGVGTAAGTVEVTDLNGGRLAGRVVHLVAGEHFNDLDGDGRFTAGTDQLLDDVDGNQTWTAVGEIDADVTTGSDGKASFAYRAGLVPQQVWIVAGLERISAAAPLQLQSLPAVQQLVVTSAIDRITVQDAGGLDHTQINAVGYDEHGRTVPAGVLVTFSIVSGPGGGESLEGAVAGNVNARTDANGTATATLRAGTSPGLVQVGASSASQLSAVGVTIEAGLAASLACSADSVSLVENSSCRVRAYVYDSAHNAVVDGTVVSFHANKGLVNTDQGLGRAETKNGLAVATFTAVSDPSGDSGPAEITAEANGGTNGGISCTVFINMPQPPGAISQLTLNASPMEIAVKGTGETWATSIRAQGLDQQNRPVGPDRSVTFRITEGPGGGEHFFSAGDSADVRTDAAGVAEVILESGTVSGTVVVTVRATESTRISKTTAIGIAAGPPVYLDVAPQICNVYACGRVNELNPIVVLVYDTYRNPVRDGTAVYFTSNIGMIEGNQGLGTSATLRGTATATWHSSSSCGSGLATVTASTLGGELTASADFLASGLPYSAAFIPTPADTVEMVADAGRTVERFVVEVLDQNGRYTLPTKVEVTSIYGTVPVEIQTDDGCNSSVAEGSYKTPVLTTDEWFSVPDNGVGAVDVVRVHAKNGAIDDTFLIKLRTGSASASKSTVDIAGPVPLGGIAIFSVTIKDKWGNPLGGHALSLTASAGAVTPTGTTDAEGTVSGLTFTAPNANSTVLIEIHDDDPNYGNLILRKTVVVSGP